MICMEDLGGSSEVELCFLNMRKFNEDSILLSNSYVKPTVITPRYSYGHF